MSNTVISMLLGAFNYFLGLGVGLWIGYQRGRYAVIIEMMEELKKK